MPPKTQSAEAIFFFFFQLYYLVYIENGLQLDDQLPLVGRHVLPVEVLQAVDAGAGDGAVERVLLLEVAAVLRLVAAHLDLDGD